MPLSQAQEDREHLLRIANMAADTELKVEQARWEPWKLLVAAVTAAAVLFGSFGVVVGYVIGLARH